MGQNQSFTLSKMSAKSLMTQSNFRRQNLLLTPRFFVKLLRQALPRDHTFKNREVKALRQVMCQQHGFASHSARIQFEREVRQLWSGKRKSLSHSSLWYLDNIILTIDNHPKLTHPVKRRLVTFLDQTRFPSGASYSSLILSKLKHWLYSWIWTPLSTASLRKMPALEETQKGKERAHVLSLYLAVKLWKKIFGCEFVTKRTIVGLRQLLSKKENFTMVDIECNRIIHVSQDAEIAKALQSTCDYPVKLSKGSNSRVKDVIRFLKNVKPSDPIIKKFVKRSRKLLSCI